MARRKKPENETVDEATQRRLLDTIADFSTRSEKTSWNRKLDNMVKLMSKLPPIEDKIFKIMKEEKQPILDEIAELRTTMIQECVHPYEQLVLTDDYIHCKFCNTKFAVIVESTEETNR